MFILRLCSVFTDEQSEGGELDLDGIDDQEIDKVSCPSYLIKTELNPNLSDNINVSIREDNEVHAVHMNLLIDQNLTLIGSSVLQYILNEREVEVKTELWMKQNAEYLKEQKGQTDFIIFIIIISSSSSSSSPTPISHSACFQHFGCPCCRISLLIYCDSLELCS